ncbi:dATP/dGTP diphosphohydrolase domain-containing protein [Nocardioides sp. Leaf285]|uniref:dATP/dGTP diphosphohydrolase domain-containing protein n=1 Tax=Nocardioides sp. Leaf285 TaxID=1736322 RepID=UPI000703B163|nr:dATP/dGTP diphosphohydrolase domain-containing protein [Nocardioides sp. Leaf285]KQP62944.1 hypothetical protein ASF47_18195 [Nocardioides sp. Leaf285]
MTADTLARADTGPQKAQGPTPRPASNPAPMKHDDVHAVYLAGPMTGIPAFNYPAFMNAAAALEGVGYAVFNPATHTGLDTRGLTGNEAADHPSLRGLDRRVAFLAYTQFILAEADAVAVLPGWETSKGARAEVALALAAGLLIIDAMTGERTEVDLRAAEPQTPRCASQRPVALVPAITAARRSESGEVRITSATGGQKGQKEAAFDLIPAGVLRELAVLFGRGNLKYPPGPDGTPNWKAGYPWSLTKAALDRHINTFWSREEDYDAEMGVKHVVNAIWHLIVLAWFMENRPEFDDRPRAETYVGALPTPQWLLDKAAADAAQPLIQDTSRGPA